MLSGRRTTPACMGTEFWLSADEIIAIDMGTHAEERT